LGYTPHSVAGDLAIGEITDIAVLATIKMVITIITMDVIIILTDVLIPGTVHLKTIQWKVLKIPFPNKKQQYVVA
jgi:hypothetical protein